MKLVKISRITKKLKKELEKYLTEKGFEYCRYNVEYSNLKAKTSYSSYLQQALKENWAEEYAEKKQEVKEKASKETEVRDRIDNKGGPGKAKYQGRQILFMTPCGPAVEVEGENPVVTLWGEVKQGEIS